MRKIKEKYHLIHFLLLIIIFLCVSCRKARVREFENQEWFSGGSQTVFLSGVNSYAQPFPTLSPYYKRLHEIGDIVFESTFISSPAPKNPGLGPVFNNVSCVSCHINDGRGKATVEGQGLSATLLRLSIPGIGVHGGPIPVPLYGGQLQQQAIFGSTPEASVTVNYTYLPGSFPDGESYELRKPIFTISNYYAGPVAGMLVSARNSPAVFGLGLIEGISEIDILKYQDIHDSDNDGISGKANYVWNIYENKTSLGRFGWKANTPSLLQQVASAFNEDMGITNLLFPNENSHGQIQDNSTGNKTDLSDSLLHITTFYMQTLAVPARRNVEDPMVKRGKQIFEDAQCAKCHVPSYRTAVNVAFKDISNQLIFPYTDLLLHDMGSDLTDNRPDFLADGQEWRTPPLWGIGLSEVVNGHSDFLHDGRARNLKEAILWHGGEAENSKNYFIQLPKADREALIQFLRSL